MRLLPRHYVLLLAIVGLGVFNIVRLHRAHPPAGTTRTQTTRGTSPAWSLYDSAAALRDAPDAQFQPALRALTDSIANTNAVAIPPQASNGELSDLHGCHTWLLFYRQEFLHPSTNRPGWSDQTLQHVLSCASDHRDAAK
jgi:hypothetical protein